MNRTHVPTLPVPHRMQPRPPGAGGGVPGSSFLFFLFPLLFLLCGQTGLHAQILDVDPVFPKQNDTVTIIYNATEGNGALTGTSPVYAHTGLITSQSSNPNDWRHVQGNWGTADPNVLMTSLGNDRHSISYHIPAFYGVPAQDTVYKLAFVFRNTDGSTVGRDADGSDIFYPVYADGQLHTAIVLPVTEQVLVNAGDTIPVKGAASDTATLTLTDNGTQIAQATGTELLHDLVAGAAGGHTVILTANDGNTVVRDTFRYTVNPAPVVQNPPAGTQPGINYIDSATVRLSLYAPDKDFVYVTGSFNGFQPDTSYFMHNSPDGNTWWLEISGLTPGQTYTFQYFVDGELKIADPYSELVLDPANDGWISAATYPNMPAYPTGQTDGFLTVFTPGKAAYDWQNTSFQKPAVTDLVIYELLVRDFLAAHDYATLLDTLDYLSDLGVNAIELMPVNEFEGNESWGYNPSFHMALDKYYGPAEDLKAFIDTCHGRGIAVILDVVYNHAFSQSPLAQLYWDPVDFKPTPDNPWLNPDARHPFNVGYDFNHESAATRTFVERVITYWLEAFRVDGYRFDLSKGFTQTFTNDVGAWGQYDASRIAILKNYADMVWAADPDAYVILEHFADNSEEKELADYGMLLWGNHNYNYNEATMGFISNSNFEWIDYKLRNWNGPHVVGYMESHDEERLMYRNLEFGNSSGGYDIRDAGTARRRNELAGCFFFTLPGPKMMWEFGELGYDISRDDPCNVCPHPPRWNDYTDPDRHRLFKIWRALIRLRQEHQAFRTTQYSHSLGGAVKQIWLNDASMNVMVIGNFGVNSALAATNFQHTGWWYAYFTGDSINVTNTAMNISLTPGEYRLYTDARLPVPDLSGPVSAGEPVSAEPRSLDVWPNPAHGHMTVAYELHASGEMSLALYDLFGREVLRIAEGWQAKGMHRLEVGGEALRRLPEGRYLLRLSGNGQTGTAPVLIGE